MSENTVNIMSFSAPEVDRREILRYAGIRESDENTETLLTECISESADRLSYKACFAEYPISRVGGELDLGFAVTSSASLGKLLSDCGRVVVFCATVGVDMDRLIARYSLISPSRSVMLQALGSERVEALCDALCDRLSAQYGREGCSLTRRFSPGYGDLPLDMQRDIFAALRCEKRIGVTLGENLFMTPTKSVTAIIGVKK